MSERFEVGEVAIYVSPGAAMHGSEVLITGPLQEREVIDNSDGRYKHVMCYQIRCDGERRGGGCATPSELRKKKPPALDRDCYRITSWGDGVWQPKEVVVEIT